jgi:uncharacterized protein YprB with RNaseH-like and TPR domain
MISSELALRLRELPQEDSSVSFLEHAEISPTLEIECRRFTESQLQGHEIQTPVGAHWLVREKVGDLWPVGMESLRTNRTTEHVRTTSKHRADLNAIHTAFPSRVFFLDIETCGLAGSMIFLAGVLHSHNDEMVLSQFFARDYSEEKPLLYSLWQIVSENDVLVTFNGKSFDWPQVRDRSTLHQVPNRVLENRSTFRRCPAIREESSSSVSQPILHVDALHHARRRWRKRVPDCKLQTLERHICRRIRRGDIPGFEIPAAYHEFVRTRRAQRVHSILHHNAMDLVTLLQLTISLCNEEEPDAILTVTPKSVHDHTSETDRSRVAQRVA